MPDKNTMQRARNDKREGKAPSTQAGEFVHEEISHVRQGKHGVRSAKQAVAIGLSKARRAGVKIGKPKKGGTASTAKKRMATAKPKMRAQPKAATARARKTSVKRAGTASRSLPRMARSSRTKPLTPTGQARTAARRRKPRSKATARRNAK